MQTVTTNGLDIAKSVFQVHGIDAEGKVVIRRQLKRRYVLAFFQKLAPCLTLSALPVHRRRACCDPLRQDPWHQTSALAHRIVGAAANEGCRDRARQ